MAFVTTPTAGYPPEARLTLDISDPGGDVHPPHGLHFVEVVHRVGQAKSKVDLFVLGEERSVSEEGPPEQANIKVLHPLAASHAIK